VFFLLFPFPVSVPTQASLKADSLPIRDGRFAGRSFPGRPNETFSFSDSLDGQAPLMPGVTLIPCRPVPDPNSPILIAVKRRKKPIGLKSSGES